MAFKGCKFWLSKNSIHSEQPAGAPVDTFLLSHWSCHLIFADKESLDLSGLVTDCDQCNSASHSSGCFWCPLGNFDPVIYPISSDQSQAQWPVATSTIASAAWSCTRLILLYCGHVIVIKKHIVNEAAGVIIKGIGG